MPTGHSFAALARSPACARSSTVVNGTRIPVHAPVRVYIVLYVCEGRGPGCAPRFCPALYERASFLCRVRIQGRARGTSVLTAVFRANLRISWILLRLLGVLLLNASAHGAARSCEHGGATQTSRAALYRVDACAHLCTHARVLRIIAASCSTPCREEVRIYVGRSPEWSCRRRLRPTRWHLQNTRIRTKRTRDA